MAINELFYFSFFLIVELKHPFSNVGGSYQTHSNLQAHPQEYVVGVPPINTGTVASTSTGMAVPQPPSSPQPPPIQANIPPPPPPPCAPSLPTHSNSLEKGNLPGIKATGSGDRGGLLQSIQAGTKLKKVHERSNINNHYSANVVKHVNLHKRGTFTLLSFFLMLNFRSC